MVGVMTEVRLETDSEAATPDAFDQLFLERYDPLVRALTAAFGDREQAADAVQEAFVRAFARWRRVRRLEDPAAWVRRVAVNLLIDHTRRRDRGRLAVDRLGARTAQSVDGPDGYVGEGEMLARLADLPQQQRIAVSLFYVEDLSVAEVAAAMNLTAGAVKYHLNRGRTALRTAAAHKAE